MSEKPLSPANPPKPVILQYQSAEEKAAARPPRWVYGIVLIYLLLWVAVFTFPGWFSALEDDRSGIVPESVIAAIMTICGLSLMVIPVKMIRQRGISRRAIWIPLIASGFLIGALFVGACIAVGEYFRVIGPIPGGQDAPRETLFLWAILTSAAVIWSGWTVVFGIITKRGDAAGIGMKLYRWLIAGSVLELIIAVPAHLVVRRRTECCAGFYTASAICIGVCVAFISFGPGVFLLYHRRFRRISRRRA